jgi:hypothetical protein
VAGLPPPGEPGFPRQKTDPEHPEEVQPHRNDDKAAQFGKKIHVLAQRRTDAGSTGSQCNEHRGKAQGKEQRGKEYRAPCVARPRLGTAAAEILD